MRCRVCFLFVISLSVNQSPKLGLTPVKRGPKGTAKGFEAHVQQIVTAWQQPWKVGKPEALCA